MNSAMKRAAYFTALMLILSIAGGGARGQTVASEDDGNSPAQDNSSFLDAAGGGAGAAPGHAPAVQQQLSDLTLGNFFSDGWNDNYALRQRPTGTPDYPLLRVQTNELLRLLRVNFYDQHNLKNATRLNLVDLDGFVDWAFNRRFMIEVDAAHQWVDNRSGSNDFSGDNSYALLRFKLIDTEASECTFNFKVTTPNYGTGVNDSTITYAITGFEDLAYWLNMDRVGLYYTVSFDNLAGPAAVGAQRNDVQYDISIAKTVTRARRPDLQKPDLV